MIKKELKEQAKKSEQILGQQKDEPIINRSTKQVLNPILTQEERHRVINEKREQRKKEQRLKQLEESKERRIVKEPA